MDRSMFSKVSSRHDLLSNSSHELPRWRSPSPMAASIIPPPIVESTYSSPPSDIVQSLLVEKPSPLQDRQSELEADLQFLLDAQAEGLVRGLEGGMVDDQTSTGSTTPTAQSVRSASARRVAKPVRRKPGLRSARKGIYNAIIALSTVKDEETHSFDDDLREKQKTLDQIQEWENKKQGLQEATRTVDANEETVRVQRLRKEADTLQEEIGHVELQLADMKARHRKLMRQITTVDNSVQAKLASYTSSLRLLEDDIQKFLSLKPTDIPSRPISREGETSIWHLPPQRRTLEMAKQHWDEERDSIIQQRESVQYEKSASEEGAIIWKDVVAQVTEFERRLRDEMSMLSANGSKTPEPSQDDASQRLRDVLEHMTRLTGALESKIELAKDRSWNLLIAAIGAELDALKQGRQLLENVLRSSEDSLGQSPETFQHDSSPSSDNDIHELDKSFERRTSDTTHSDDDPDPELLFSKHDTDTE